MFTAAWQQTLCSVVKPPLRLLKDTLPEQRKAEHTLKSFNITSDTLNIN